MTYCCAILLQKGLVFASDSRTNAGADHISTYSKLFTFNSPDNRSFVILTAGNLATTQATISRIAKDIKEDKEVNLFSVSGMLEAAEYLGQLSVSLAKKTENSISAGSLDASASYIIGGQIGETKYGKPILDRIITPEISLEKAALCALVSMDSTMRSNATVGPPIEALIYERNEFSTNHKFVFPENDSYLIELKNAWDKELKNAFHRLTQFNWHGASQREVGK